MAPCEPAPASIVVVDDAPANLILLANILEDAGYEVRVANSGQRALTLIERQPPDLVLLDVNLPDQDGFQVCLELKTKEALRRVPVIFLSADDDPVAKARALDAGGVEYLVKPFDAAEVLARIAIQLRLARALAASDQLKAEVAEWKSKARASFAALCAALPGSALDGTLRLTSMIEGDGSSARFRATRIADGVEIAVEVFPPGRVRHAAASGADVVEAAVSETGIPYRVLPTA